MKYGLHCERRPLKQRFDGARAFGFGPQFGYWPCLHAPYVSLVFLFWRFDVWFGLPGYTKHETEQTFLRKLVDMVWSTAREDGLVPTEWADAMIDATRTNMKTEQGSNG